jgi:hypothetical protein
MRSARRSRSVSGFRRYSATDSTVSYMSLLRAKRVLCAFVTVAICASCASLKPVKEPSVISDADVPSGITTSPGSGFDGTRAPNPGVATPSVITQPPSAAQDSYRTLSSLLLARGDLPSSWEEDTSGSGEMDTTEGWLGLGSCLRTPVPVLEASGSSFSNDTTSIAVLTTTSSLFATPLDAQTSLVALDDVRPGGVANSCFMAHAEQGFSGDGVRAEAAAFDVAEDAVPGLSNRTISGLINVTDGQSTFIFFIRMTVAVTGSAALVVTSVMEADELTDYSTDIDSAYAAVFGRLISVYGAR